MKAMKRFVIEQILLVKNSVNNKLGNNTQLQKKSNKKSYRTYESWQKRYLTEVRRHLFVSGIIDRGDDYKAKVQKVNDFLSEIRTRKNMKYIDNGNISLGTLNRSEFHLNRFVTIQLVKNCREIFKI